MIKQLKKFCRKFFLLFFMVTVLVGNRSSLAAEPTSNLTAILPFEVHAAKDLSYLRSGIRDMLASRLASGAGVRIVNKSKTDAALTEGKVAPRRFLELSNRLGADYLVVGSFTSLGGGASIDAKVFARQTRTTHDFFATAPKEDDVIMAINNLAWEIGEKIFGKARPSQAAAGPAPAPTAQAPVYQTAHPERAYFGGNGSYGSPFIRPMGITGAFGFTKSQNFKMDLQAMDVADVDGDGRDDVVLADREKVKVYRITEGRFVLLAEAQVPRRYKIHYLSLADLNSNGRAEIYVSANDKSTPDSMGLELQQGKLVHLFKEARFYVRAMKIPGEGLILAGQKGGDREQPFSPGIFQLYKKDGTLKTGIQIPLPAGVNLFDFVMTDLESDGRPEVVAIDQNDKIRIMRQSGRQIWKSTDYYGGSKRFVGEVEFELSAGRVQRYYVPTRMIAMDVNNDRNPDIIVNKNLSTTSRVFKNVKSYPNGEIHALSWSGIGLGELWHTVKIDGYIAGYQLRELPEEGKAILYVGVILSTGADEIMGAGECAVLMYPLDLSADQTKGTKGG